MKFTSKVGDLSTLVQSTLCLISLNLWQLEVLSECICKMIWNCKTYLDSMCDKKEEKTPFNILELVKILDKKL